MAVATGEHRGEPTGGQHSGESAGDTRQPVRVRAERAVNGADHTDVKDEQEECPADQQHCRSHFDLQSFNISTVAFHLHYF